VTTTFDAVGNTIGVKDALNNVTSFTYDGKNRKTNEIDAVGTSIQQILTYTYDLAGDPLTQSDGNGNVTSYTYNAFTSKFLIRRG
jgi:YD repeat-containing protein